MNGFDETVRSISSTGTGTTGTIAIGSQTLTINDQAGDTNTYTSLYTTSAGGKIIKNGDGTLILNNFPNGFVGGEFIVNSGTIGVGQNNIFGTFGNASKLTINPNNLPTGPTLKRTGGTINLAVSTMDIGGNFTYDTNGANDTQYNGANGTTTTTLKADNPVITVMGDRTSGTFIFAGDIVDDGNVRGFTKAGPGVLTLGSQGNSYRGETTIQEGYLRVRKQTNAGNTGVTRIGDGMKAVNLSGGTLEYNGSLIASIPAENNRILTVTNPINVTADSGIGYYTTGNAGTDTVTFIFSSDSITGTGGTLTFDRATSNASTLNAFKPTFSGSGFSFGRPIVMNNESSTKTIELNSTNTTGTQTWSGAISGDASYRRSGAGATVFSGANTFSGGTIVDGGTLTASGASATLGGGNVTVNAGHAAIAAGVADAIANTKKLTLLGGGTGGVADEGYIDLASGISERVGTLVLGSTTQINGLTYGSTSSSALVQNNEYFSSSGIISVGVPGDFNDDNVVDGGDYILWRRESWHLWRKPRRL